MVGKTGICGNNRNHKGHQNSWGLKIDKYQLQVGEKICAHVNIESKKRGEYWSASISIWDIERLNLT